jgi:hypothetical protein
MMTLKTKNENIIIQYKSIVQAILREINIRNISIPDFCEDMLIDVDEFIDSLSDIKSDFSYYLEILEALKNY